MRYNDANKMTLHPCHMRHSPIFDKIDSFLKPVLSIFILCNFILGGCILHQICTFRGAANGWWEKDSSN